MTSELNTITNLMLQCMELIESSSDDLNMTAPEDGFDGNVDSEHVSTRKHFGAYVKNLATSKKRIGKPFSAFSRETTVPDYVWLYNLMRKLHNIFDTGGFEYYIDSTSANPKTYLASLLNFFSSDHKDARWDKMGFMYDFASLSPVHMRFIKERDAFVETFAIYGDPDANCSYYGGAPRGSPPVLSKEGGGDSRLRHSNGVPIQPLFGEVVVDEHP